ncbi:innexin inx1-like isoform X2 [Clytia hemisphaerica]|uniref:Innexin n=2 Tax=Clytia hemisphaerica TaxID=252671 RepID=A0A7M5UL65_9CNID
MHGLTTSLWEVISWKSKSQYDTAGDQYTRIFMPKLFIISSLIMAFSYFNDKLNCMVSSRLNGLKEFVQETCWIQGFYIYHEMHTKLNESSYYGIPEYTGYNGITKDGQLCSTINRAGGVHTKCAPMTKRYFLHYQWVPFYVVSLAILYYVPYLIFKSVNSDLISLVDTVETGNLRDVDKIANNYFNYRINSKVKMKIIVWVNLMIKVIFIVVNISGFLLTDYTMDGRFIDYGLNWISWNDVPNHIAHDIVKRGTPKPGDHFLPSVGMCDIHEALNDKRGIYIDKHKVICEISQNIRYQYNFIILWFFFASGLVISSFGLLHSIFKLLKSMFWVYSPKLFDHETSLSNRVHSQLTLREMEYLDKIRQMDMTMYGEILRELTRYKPSIGSIKKFAPQTTSEMITLLPSAPKEIQNHWDRLV